MAARRSLHVVDYVIFVGMLLITMGIGIYHAIQSKKRSTTSEYLMGSRDLRTVPVAISLMASFISTVLILGFPAETYLNGVSFWWQFVGVSLGAIMATVFMVPVFHPLRLTSINEYLKLRYNSTFIAILGTCSSLTFMLLYSGIVSYAPATAFHSVTGFPTWASILIGSGITIIYTAIGGFKAVIWTDVFQFVIMVISLLAISIRAVMSVGSMSLVWKTCGEWDRLQFFHMDPDPTLENTFWANTVGLMFTFFYTYGASQSSFQRFCSLPTLPQARLCVLLVMPGVTLMITLAALAGLSMFAFYASIECDPLKAGYLDNANQLVPHFVMDELHLPGIPGLLFAGLASASLSTASSALNAAAANMWDDVLRRIWPNLPEGKNVLITKGLVVVFGLVSMGLAFAVSVLGGTVIRSMLSFAAAIGAPTTAMFLMGIILPFVNGKGAATGGVVGFSLALWVAFGSYSSQGPQVDLGSPIDNCTEYLTMYRPHLLTSTVHPAINSTAALLGTTSAPAEESGEVNWALAKLYSISYLWYGMYSMIISFLVAIVVSMLTGRTRNNYPEARLLHPWVRRFAKQHEASNIKQAYANGVAKESFGDPAFSSDAVVITKM